MHDLFVPAERIVLAFLPSGPCVARTEVVDGEEILVVAGVRVRAGYQTFAPDGLDGSLHTRDGLRRAAGMAAGDAHAQPTPGTSAVRHARKISADRTQPPAAQRRRKR